MNFIRILDQAWQVLLSSISRLSSLIKLDKLHRTWQTLLDLRSFIKVDKFYQAWSASSILINVYHTKFCQNWWISSSLIHFNQLYHVRTLPASLMFAWIGGGTACDVFSGVRHSRMWCPHDIGRDSWVWGEQETLYNIISPPTKWGMKPWRCGIPLSWGSGVAHG